MLPERKGRPGEEGTNRARQKERKGKASIEVPKSGKWCLT